MENKSPTFDSTNKAKLKAANFCAYQERTQQQVRTKLISLGVEEEETEEIIADLIIENFINEERFAKSFVSGKFRLKKWGKLKIIAHLKQLNLTEYCIDQGIKEIPRDEYLATICSLINKKIQEEKIQKLNNSYQRNHKIAGYIINKGFEPELVWETLKREVD